MAASAPARADVAPAAAGDVSGHGYVELTVAADDDSKAALVGTLRELVARLGLELRVSPMDSTPGGFMGAPPRDPGERARVSVDETPGDRVTVVLAVVRRGEISVPVERVMPRGESSAILTEQVAHVIHATLESLLATDAPLPAASPPKAASPIVPVEHPVDKVVAAPVSHRQGFSLDATAFATGRGVSSETGAVLGGGAALDMTAWRGIGRPSLWISGSYNAPFDQQNADVTLQTTVSSFRGVPSILVLASRILDVNVGVGAGVDVFHCVPSNPGPNVTVRSTSDLVDPVLTGQIVTRIRVATSARIVVGIEVDYDAAAHRYVTADSGVHTGVFQPWLVRPSAMVGLCVPLMGALGCAGAE